MAINALNKFKDYIGWGDESGEYTDYQQEQSVGHGGLRATSAVSEPKLGGIHSMTTIHPQSFNDARTIGEAFRDGLTTVVNLGALSDADGRRIVDFFSGLAFALHGQIERVDQKVFILTPAEIDVVTEGQNGNVPVTEFYNHG